MQHRSNVPIPDAEPGQPKKQEEWDWEAILKEAQRVQKMVMDGYTRVWKTEAELPISQDAGVSSVGESND